MGRIDDFELKDPELNEFKNQLRDRWNFGKYAVPILTAGTPTWRAQPGEMVILAPASGGRTTFAYIGSAWVVLATT